MLLYLTTPTRTSDQLTPIGAARLRSTRAYLRQHPRSLNMAVWHGCLAWHIEHQAIVGWRARLAHWWRGPSRPGGEVAARLLGFADVASCTTLFYGYDPADAGNVDRAIARINLFLAAHGYP